MVYLLADFGSYTVGGREHHTAVGEPKLVQFTRDVSFICDPRGTRAIEHAYVQYFVPSERRPGPPVVLLHGGGMSGTCWETTPDGRPGWLHLLLRQGFEVHVMDNMERGRAGFAPDIWPDRPFLRTKEEAWSLFRIGAADDFSSRKAFDCQRFPVSAFDSFARSFAPRWFSTAPGQADCLKSLLERTGKALVICHSQGAQIAFDTLATVPHLVAGLVALEPSGDLPAYSNEKIPPTVIVAGGFLDTSALWTERRDAWRRSNSEHRSFDGPLRLLETDEVLGPGHSHMLMMDHGNDRVLSECLGFLCNLSDH